jgi:isopenicillin N synthase-like dioxygenase
MTGSTRELLTVRTDPAIPVIDLARYLDGAPGAQEVAAAEVRRALQHIGFFILINHGVPQGLIDATFAEAKRFHDQPLDAKLAVRMNEHNNGYMLMGRYAVWTSEVQDEERRAGAG